MPPCFCRAGPGLGTEPRAQADACSTCPMAAARARRWTCFRARSPMRRCWCSSTAATGARSTSPTIPSSRRPSMPTGAMVVVPNYALCPAVSIEHIALQMVAALAWVWRHAPSMAATRAHRRGRALGRRPPGGHAAELPLEARWPTTCRAPLVPARCRSPACTTWSPPPDAFLQADLKLTPAAVRRLSPAFFPRPKAKLYAVVGGRRAKSSCARTS
jgi:hypothetical protein